MENRISLKVLFYAGLISLITTVLNSVEDKLRQAQLDLERPTNRPPSPPQRAEASQKRAVKFVDVEAEDEAEVDEPKWTYSYDPVAHKVVFVPSE